MTEHYRLAGIASLLGEPTRARIVSALMGGAALPATELSLAANVRPSTASEHLALLVSGGVLASERRGRHRYYRLSGAHVAELVESMAAFRPACSETPSAGRMSPRRRGRTCYDHLAGELGVRVTEALLARALLVETHGHYALPTEGRQSLADIFGAIPPGLPGKKCLDATERRHHCGGQLGAAIARAMFDARWITPGFDSRLVHVTRLGARELAARLDVEIAPG